MSETPPSELLDRIRRRVVAGVIRVGHMTGESFSELTDAVELLEELIAIERLKEQTRNADTKHQAGRVRRHRNRKADSNVPAGDSGTGEEASPVAAGGDSPNGSGERGGHNFSSDATDGGAVGDCQDQGGVRSILAAGPDAGEVEINQT